jgi:hypothetical protein
VVPLAFGKTIDYRDAAVMGDPKFLWEPNRHHHLVSLAQAFALTGDPRFSAGIGRDLSSWMAQCPHPLGPNWANGLEVAIRLINWSVTWQLVGGPEAKLFADGPGQTLRDAWLESVYRHAHFIRHYLSRYSSANNHLLGELTGLVLAGLTWPWWKRLRAWGGTARAMLVDEAFRQVGDDGVHREQAVGYHMEAMEYLGLAAAAGRAAGRPFPEAFEARVERMAGFVTAITDRGAHTPMFGDADGGAVLRLAPPGTDRAGTRSRPAEAALWLPGGETAAVAKALPAAFPDGGYYVLSSRRGTADETLLVADAGPLGLPPLAAHGHADALAFTLSVGGREFLVDPGTYDYYSEPRWREYFRSTAAHNTVRVDGLDQSVSAGRFLWKSKARTALLNWRTDASADMLEAAHDGYRRLPDPVGHRRTIVLHKGERVIRVTDRFDCGGSHVVEWFWHFGAECQVRTDGARVTAANGPWVLSLAVPASLRCTLYLGDEDRPAGWRSPAFGVRVPCPTVVWRGEIHGSASFETVCSIQGTEQ